MSLWKNTQRPEASEEPALESPRTAPSHTSAPLGHRELGEGAEMANIGKSISIKGDVLGEEDTLIEGRVEGRIELKNHHLTIGVNGDVQGEVAAKQITIEGRVSGNVIASERIELRDSARLEGDLTTPRLLVQEGSQLNGKISMKGASGAALSPAPGPKKVEETPRATGALSAG